MTMGMGWYPRSLALRTFFTSKISPQKSTAQQPISISRTNLFNNPTRASSLFSPASSTRLIMCSNFKPKKQHPWKWSTISTRCYYVDNNQVRHFKRRGYAIYMTHPAFVFAILALGSGILISLYVKNSQRNETVPYTKRRHFVLLSKHAEMRYAEAQFGKLKEALRDRILPLQHPECVRIRSIAEAIVLAVERGSRKDESWTDLSYDNAKTLGENVEDGEWVVEDEFVDIDDDGENDEWIEQSRKEAKEKGTRCATGHLEGLKWEIMIVDAPTIVNATCLAGGKIIVFTGLLKYFKTDAEIATVIAHEVGHAVGRHIAEMITKEFWYRFAERVLYRVFTPDIAKKMSNYLLRFPFSRRMELEADYIGLLLMAAAGYDPRKAPLTYQKLGKLSDKMALEDFTVPRIPLQRKEPDC